MIAVKGIPLPKIEPTHAQFLHGQMDLFTEPKLPWVGWYEAIEDLLGELPRSCLTERQKRAIETRGIQIEPPGTLIATKFLGRNGHLSVLPKEPAPTLTAIGASYQPLLIERVGDYGSPKIRNPEEPCWTLRSHLGDDGKGNSRSKVIDAIVGVDVRSLDTQALARLQSFPDWYQWSERAALDTRVIGNSVPPIMAQRICEALTVNC